MILLGGILLSLLLPIVSGEAFVQWWDPEWSHEEFCTRVPEGKLERLANQQRHLVFKVGPPASGKSDALDHALREIGIDKQPYVEVNIDNLVNKSEAYRLHRELAMGAMKTVFAQNMPKDKTALMAGFVPILPPAVVQVICQMDFGAYFRERPRAKAEAEAILFQELLETPHYRNIVYESTGSHGSYRWILKLARMARMHGFRVHIVYPVVRWTELVRRSEIRALREGRLVCPDRLRLIRWESRVNLREIIRKIDMPAFPIDSVMLIYNDGPRGKRRPICHFHKIVGRTPITPEVNTGEWAIPEPEEAKEVPTKTLL